MRGLAAHGRAMRLSDDMIARYEIQLMGETVDLVRTLKEARDRALAGREIVDRYATIGEPQKWFVEMDGTWTVLQIKRVRS